MTSSPPVEAPHYNGKITTPESPLPLHIPEPSNIPVLENQIDPIFNLMSTHLDKKPLEQPQPTSTGGVASQLHNQNMGEAASGQINTNNTDGAEDVSASKASVSNGEHSAAKDGYQPQAHQPNELLSAPFHQNSLISTPTSSTPLSERVPATSNAASLEAQLNETVSAISTRKPQAMDSDPTQAQGLESQISQNVAEAPRKDESEAPQSDEQPNETNDREMSDGNAIFQSLLDSLSPTTTIAADPNPLNAASSSPGASKPIEPTASHSSENPSSTLPAPAGLPPRPPPQEKPTIHPHYAPNQDISSYHITPATQATSQTSPIPLSSISQANDQNLTLEIAHNESAPNGLPPPPLATFQQASSLGEQAQTGPQGLQVPQPASGQDAGDAVPREDNDKEVEWGPEVEKIWLEFLQAEAIYVSEGTWDRFPQGSRLFVGNLFTEKASKRDLFFVFHRYGKLAQISIKNAYGFIQFHDTFACSRALQEEQGLAIRGKKIHLEVSKPQKNTRGTGTNSNQRQNSGRRSRSPDQGRRNRGSGQILLDRYDGRSQQNGYRQRDDYRPLRSPSPRGGFRGRDEYRGRARSPTRYNSGRSRSRSPFDRYGNYRIMSPQQPDFDDEASLPIPRRDPRDVPDVQIVILDDIDRAFVGYIDKSFRDRGLASQIYTLAPRLSLEAFTKRQILEGVQAVVKIMRQSQVTGKIPLQVFDRTDRNNVQFAEYDQLDAGIAAELVVRAKQQRAAAPPQPPSIYGVAQYQSAPQVPHYPHPQQQPSYPPAPQPQPQQLQSPTGGQPNLQNLITSMDGPTLQKLLGAIGQNGSGQQPSQADLTAILGAQQQPPQHQPQQQGYNYAGTPQQQPPSQHYQQQASYAGSPTTSNSFGNNPALAQILGTAGLQAPPPPQQQQQLQSQYQGGGQQNVGSIIEQLTRFRQ